MTREEAKRNIDSLDYNSIFKLIDIIYECINEENSQYIGGRDYLMQVSPDDYCNKFISKGM